MKPSKASVLYVPIIGGLCSGKSTAVGYVKNTFRGITVLEEAAARVLKVNRLENGWSGARSEDIVRKIGSYTHTRLAEIVEGAWGKRVVEESGLLAFLGHLRADGYVSLAQEYEPKLPELLAKVDPFVVFIDVPPDIAWERRKERYRAQTKRFVEKEGGNEEEIMRQLKTRMEGVYANVKALYTGLASDKVTIPNVDDEPKFLERLASTLPDILGRGAA